MKSKQLTYFLITLLMAGSQFIFAADQNAKAGNQEQVLEVYKDETCTCCGAWVEHLNKNGFATRVHVSKDLNQIKTKYAINAQYQSCHTGVSKNGYVFEGHVPARVISQFLANPPKEAIGLAVPGMPVGSPGMEAGNKFTPYDVLLLKKNGMSEVYEHITKME